MSDWPSGVYRRNNRYYYLAFYEIDLTMDSADAYDDIAHFIYMTCDHYDTVQMNVSAIINVLNRLFHDGEFVMRMSMRELNIWAVRTELLRAFTYHRVRHEYSETHTQIINVAFAKVFGSTPAPGSSRRYVFDAAPLPAGYADDAQRAAQGPTDKESLRQDAIGPDTRCRHVTRLRDVCSLDD